MAIPLNGRRHVMIMFGLRLFGMLNVYFSLLYSVSFFHHIEQRGMEKHNRFLGGGVLWRTNKILFTSCMLAQL